MSANSTSSDESLLHSTPHHGQASGASVFWALISLALNTVIQPSFCGHLFSGDAFAGGAFWPHRSSPVVCLVDAAADIWMIVARRPRPERYERTPEDDSAAIVTSTAVVARLVLFIVSVLPQAIKLFSMRDIPASQAAGAIYFVAAFISTARSIAMRDAISTNRPDPESGDSSAAREHDPNTMTTDFAKIVFVFAQGGLLCAIWSRIGAVIDLHASQDAINAASWGAALIGIIVLAHMTQHTLSILLRGQWTLPRMPGLVMVLLLGTGSFPALLLRSPEDRVSRQSKAISTAIFVANTGLCCFAFAWTLIAVAEGVHRLRRWSAKALPASASYELPIHTGTTGEGKQGDIIEGEGPGPASPPVVNIPASCDRAAETATEKPLCECVETVLTQEPDAQACTALKSAPASSVPALSSAREGQEDLASPPSALATAIRVITTILSRLGLSFTSIIIYPYDWTFHHLQRGRNPEIMWLALGIMHAVTAATYYGVVFDGAGTKAPGWTGVLG